MWMRGFIETHAAYRGDGRLSPEVADGLLRACDDIDMGRLRCAALYGEERVVPPLDLVDEEDVGPLCL